ncbi:MAG: histidine phosphatase family protein [Firmicutes bacterium]|nr:histidine phosphatase family protein [Bacillota bacterium]
MSKIFLIRHAQTKWNKEEIFRGTIDIDLDEEGIQQSGLIAVALAEYDIEAVYASPLLRAVRTANAITEGRDISVVKVEGFNDMNLGKWQGKSLIKVEEEYPEIFRTWKEEPHKAKIPGGETLNQLRKRTFSTFLKVVNENKKKNIAIVSHRVVNKILLLAILDLPNSKFWDIRQDNACINIIENEHDKFIISLLNDRCHLSRSIALRDF